jgi:hypothetical protein
MSISITEFIGELALLLEFEIWSPNFNLATQTKVWIPPIFEG